MPLGEKSILKKELAQPAVPEGVYQVEVVDLMLEENVKSQFGTRDRVSIALGILNKEQRGKTLLHFVSPSFNAGGGRYSPSKAYELACAIEGKKLDDKEPFDMDSTIGKHFNAVIKHRETERGTFANIVEVMKADKELEGLSDAERNAILEELESRRSEDVEPEEIKV